MVKEKVSVTVESEIIQKIDSKINDGTFRNRSHAFEFALTKYFKDNEKPGRLPGQNPLSNSNPENENNVSLSSSKL